MAMFIVKPWYRKKDAIYGAEWAGTSDPSWVRTDAAVGFSDPNPYYAGMSVSPSSPFDNIMPWSGMRRVTDASAGELVEIPKFYYKLSQPNGVGLKVQISMSQFDGSSVDPMHMDRGDGVGERDYAYIGRYHCGSNGYKSTSGQTPYVNATRATMRTNIHNLGSNIWQRDYASFLTLWMLYIVEFANWNSQAMIGYGCSPSGSVVSVGYTDNMPYHTGTDRTSRSTYGGTQYRYIEGVWDNVYEWLDGCYYNSNGLSIILNPSDFSDSANGTLIGKPLDGRPSAFSIANVANTYPQILPSAVGGSTSTYVCDYWSYSASSPWIFCGGGSYRSLEYGMLYIGCANAASTARGSRLMVLPPSRLSA